MVNLASPTSDLATRIHQDLEATAGATPQLPGAGVDWLDEFRANGRAAFAQHGWPTRTNEAWKYTDLRSVLRMPMAPSATSHEAASLDKAPSTLRAGSTAAALVFVDGQYRPALSHQDGLPTGVTVVELATALTERPDLVSGRLGNLADPEIWPLAGVNAALTATGSVVVVEPNVHIEKPVEIVSVGSLSGVPVTWHPRTLIVVPDGSSLDLIEYAASLGASAAVTNAVVEVMVGPGARLRHYRIQSENNTSANVGTLVADVHRDGFYESFTLTLGGNLSRLEASIRLSGTGASCTIAGAYVLNGRDHCDNTSVIEHLAPLTDSREVFKGVLGDQSHGVFQGRLVVHPHAQKINGHQLSRALLLSPDAEIDQKPELEIWADDVKCSHGATVGDLDENALFYLRSRGVPEGRARGLLIEAFLDNAFDEVSREDVRAAMATLVAARLAQTRTAA